jgi:hypothetical protein
MNSSILECQIFDRLTIDISNLRCGYHCSHVLKITNELMLDMIKVQDWKLYSSHYNDDDIGIGFELKKKEMEYQHYDEMGVLTTWETLKQSRKPSDYSDCPYLYEGATEEGYIFALSVEERICCVTYSEMSTSKDNRQDYPNKELLTSEFTADDTGDANKAILLSTPTGTQLFPSESSKIVRTEINRYKDNSLFLSPTTKKCMTVLRRHQ